MSPHDLSRAFRYEPESGKFFWLVSRGKASAGDEAGRVDGSGYIQLTYQYKRILAHRVAWLFVYGEWPKEQIDHKNGVRTDNRIDNLRQVTHAQNMQNRRAAHKNNKSSGVLGVTRTLSRCAPWQAIITANGKTHNLGSFASKDEAGAAYLAAKRVLHKFCTV